MLTMVYSACWMTLQAEGSAWSWLGPVEHSLAWQITVGLSLLLLSAALGMKLRRLPSQWRARHKSTLDPTQLEELMIGTPPQIVDLRPKMDFEGEKGHIRGALNIPYGEFKTRIHELDTSHPRPIVLVDETDALSHEMMPLLEQQGHRWLYVLKGGFREWRRAKFPIYHAPLAKKK